MRIDAWDVIMRSSTNYLALKTMIDEACEINTTFIGNVQYFIMYIEQRFASFTF